MMFTNAAGVLGRRSSPTMKNIRCLRTLTILVTAVAAVAAVPIQLHPRNPHYFIYRNKPTVLITSAEHYSSLLNRNFDYVRYFGELGKNGFNQTRIFSGTYREAAVDPHGSTPLSPGKGPENFTAPWAFSDVAGGYDGQKYDLDRWNPAYFDRLRKIARQAERHGVILELVLFCRMYSDANHWRISPLHPDNNLQGEAWRGLGYQRFLTLDNAALADRQTAFVKKIVAELKDTPNVYFEIANEPASGPHDSAFAKQVYDWHQRMAQAVVEAESSLPPRARHLIAYNDHYETGRGIGPVPKPVSILNVHYLWKLKEALDQYGAGRALSMDETRWIAHPSFGKYGNTMRPASGRMEAWEFILGGGAVYSNLNFAYQVRNETGEHAESNEFKGYLRKLQEFISGFDFTAMRPSNELIEEGLPRDALVRVLAEKGKQYAAYIHHSSYARNRNHYEVSQQSRKVDLALNFPPGSYRVEWIRPTDLSVLQSTTLRNHKGGRVVLPSSPEYQADIALRILAAGRH